MRFIATKHRTNGVNFREGITWLAGDCLPRRAMLCGLLGAASHLNYSSSQWIAIGLGAANRMDLWPAILQHRRILLAKGVLESYRILR
jgi:hypothetical protein